MRGLSEAQEKFLVEAAQGLYRFATGGYFTRGTFVDVVAWVTENTERYSRVNFAFVGNGLKIANVFGMEGGESRVFGQNVDTWLKKALGLPSSWDKGIWYERNSIHTTEFLDWVGNYIGAAYGGAWETFTEHHVTLIVEPGYPWPVESYYSAKKGKFIDAEKPGWLVEVTGPVAGSTAESHHGVNPCVVFPPDETKTEPGGHVFGVFDDGTEMMVAHSMNLVTEGDWSGGFHKHIDNAIAGIKACGGFLFPSLSVGPIPATNFGPVVLVCPLELVTKSLKPYKERGRQPCWVYDSDVWTVGTAELMRGVSIKLFEEFHGHEDWIHDHMWALGPPADAGSAPGHDISPPLKTMSSLKRAIRKRMRYWKRDMSTEKFVKTSKECAGTECAYGYCEAKAREVVDVNEFPYIVTPLSFEEEVERFVKDTGYRGEVKVLRSEVDDVAESIAEGSLGGEIEAEVMYRWAWDVADAVRALKQPVRLFEA